MAYYLVFATFLWVEEITYTQSEAQNSSFSNWYVTWQLVYLHSNKLYLSLFSLKTDSFHCRITLIIAATGNNACAVSSLQNFFSRFFLLPTTSFFQTFNNLFPCKYFILAFWSCLYRLKKIVTTQGTHYL